MFQTTLIGIGLAIGAIFASQLLEGSVLSTLAQPSGFVIVVGGTLGAVIAQSSPRDFLMGARLLQWLVRPPISGTEQYIREIVRWSRIAHQDGTLKLDSLTKAIEDPLLKAGVEMIVDYYDPDYIRETLMTDVRIRDARLKRAAKMWEAAGAYAPTVGILGSVVGLLHVMNSIGDVAKLGAGIAASFVATIYGLALANIVFLPLATKFRAMIFELTLRDELRVDGLTMIAQNKKPWLVERTLVAVQERAISIGGMKRASP